MPPAESPRRLLIVVSQDFGELSNALQLTRDTRLRARLLLPDKLLAANRTGLPLPATRYGCPRDVLDAVEREPPDLVCLFSGYLYAANNLLDLSALDALLGELRARHVPVTTTDPFLGLMQQSGTLPISARHPAQGWLQKHFAEVARLLARVPHLYHAPPDPPPGVPWAAFFNPAMLLTDAARAAYAAALERVSSVGRGRAHWLFVLAQEDYGAQAARMGRAAFEALLLDRLHDARVAQRLPVLIAPRACVDALAASGRVPDGAALLPFCGQAAFEALLMTAEHVFYWNLFSNSAPARLVNGLSALFLDIGHMAHAIPALLERGLRSYYPGGELRPLDQRQRLEPPQLSARAAEQHASLRAARERFLAQPAPEAAVERLIEAQR
jgi:hypothetical protein